MRSRLLDWMWHVRYWPKHSGREHCRDIRRQHRERSGNVNGYLLQPPPQWVPYFGNQHRAVPYVLELLRGLGAQSGDSLFEANAGSHAVSWNANKELGMVTLANDMSFYSIAIGESLQGTPAYLTTAATGAALLDEFGGQIPDKGDPSPASVEKWSAFLQTEATTNLNRRNHHVTRAGMFEMADQVEGRFAYCNFDWPHREGTPRSDRMHAIHVLNQRLGDPGAVESAAPSGRQILDDVLKFLDMAVPRFEFVILSNQSSNYPPPEVLETHLQACGHVPIVARRLVIPNGLTDDRGSDPFFTEYQYVFKGRRG